MTEYALIGLGSMGLPMARRLLAAGHTVTGYDVSPAARDAAVGDGVGLAADVAAAVRQAEVVITMLPRGEHVRAVYDGTDGIWAHARPTALLMDSSTVDMDTSRYCHDISRERGFEFVDAPVSGGVSGATMGTLAFMLGGEPQSVERAATLVQPLASTVYRTGGPTSGIAAKICNNIMCFISVLAVAEGSQLALGLGLDPRTFSEVVSGSSGRSWAQETWFPVPGVVETAAANREFAAGFRADLALKDAMLAVEAGRSAGLEMPAAELALGQFQALTDEGFGARDCTYIVKYVNPAAVTQPAATDREVTA